MTSLLDNVDEIVKAEKDLETGAVEEDISEKKSSIVKWFKDTRKEHPVLFYSLIIAVVTVIVLAIVLIIKKYKNGKSEKNDSGKSEPKETFKVLDSDETEAEYDYINKYMEAAMGKTEEYNKLAITSA